MQLSEENIGNNRKIAEWLAENGMASYFFLKVADQQLLILNFNKKK